MIKHTTPSGFICLPLWTMFFPDKMVSTLARQEKAHEIKLNDDNENEESLPIRMRGLS
jgi:hypothetical protein